MLSSDVTYRDIVQNTVGVVRGYRRLFSGFQAFTCTPSLLVYMYLMSEMPSLRTHCENLVWIPVGYKSTTHGSKQMLQKMTDCLRNFRSVQTLHDDVDRLVLKGQLSEQRRTVQPYLTHVALVAALATLVDARLLLVTCSRRRLPTVVIIIIMRHQQRRRRRGAGIDRR